MGSWKAVACKTSDRMKDIAACVERYMESVRNRHMEGTILRAD